MPKIHAINAHQKWEGFANGKLNKTLFDAAVNTLGAKGHEVSATIIDDGYDVGAEVQSLVCADAVFLQSPVYWMGFPWLFKKYMDEVFTAGIGNGLCTDDGRTRSDPSKQYGTGGLLGGRKYMISLTFNAPAEAFDDPGQFLFQGRSVDDLVFGQHMSFRFFDMEQLPTFAAFDVMKVPDVAATVERMERHVAENFADL
ncbi:MAG: NAD(P)H-dependent oxidoreductase [Rhodobacteraceae bacterium]|nr:NAD(P)H-dependent oxidoreductase [Paracoccaceae bacterium]